MLVTDLFSVKRGHKLDLTALTQVPDATGLAYVSRTEQHNGVIAWVAPVEGIIPAEAGTISVALGGSVMAAYVQPYAYYTAQNVDVLTPLNSAMTLAERLWWASCIRENRYRYNYGRHANRTFRFLHLPDEVPPWVNDEGTKAAMHSLATAMPAVAIESVPTLPKGSQRIWDLFDVQYGPSLELVRLKPDPGPTGINFVSRTSKNNGVSGRVAVIEGIEPDPAGTLSVALGGNSVLETFVQPEPWYSGRDVMVLTPKLAMSDATKLWWASCIRANRYRFSYGRQANRTLADLLIPKQVPNWVEIVPHDAVEDLRGRISEIAESTDTSDSDNPQWDRFVSGFSEVLKAKKPTSKRTSQ